MTLLFSVLLAGSAFAEATKSTTVNPNCTFTTIEGANWQMAICPQGEVKHHYATEIRFKRSGRVFYTHHHLDDPTGGTPDAKILKATNRFAVFEMGGDETNHVVAIDLDQKLVKLNTGKTSGMSDCTLHSTTNLDTKAFCSLVLNCPASAGAKTVISEYLCSK